MYGWGHEKGTRKQRKPVKPWWADAEEKTIQRIEAEWAARAPHPTLEEHTYDRSTSNTD